jgi:hypothetical protein
LQTSQITGDAGERRRVHGILLYFPKTGEGETNPNLLLDEPIDETTDDDMQYLQSSRDSGKGSQSIFNVYWQNRLVPQTNVEKIPFFPISTSKTFNIPSDWKGRVKGYLFLDGTFKHISNNKLKITVYPDFDTWINNKDTSQHILYKPRTSQSMNDLFSRLLFNYYLLPIFITYYFI